jgi:hypothetical protein
MGFDFIHRGSFDKTEKFLSAMQKLQVMGVLDKYGAMGTAALAKATPLETGETATSWSHRVEGGRGGYSIVWSNHHTIHGTNIAIILQYGHGTGTGGYVAGRDYINPAMKPIFDKIADEVWKVVTKS